MPHLMTVLVLLGLALGLLFMGWFALAACVQSGNDAEAERAAAHSAGSGSDGPGGSDVSETEHDDGSDDAGDIQAGAG